ncbi:hypothetical protein CCACVL1_05602 [Corchorus capsularis]|uniref:Uncharacterized protein n=1 Tax=Corchorus capsularis TaxID=210143 RepID=A0A1R3JJM5_COCAP|nr:hypothetical protein CCACVL1_05602 [Corchorus capsularis]
MANAKMTLEQPMNRPRSNYVQSLKKYKNKGKWGQSVDEYRTM